MDEDGLEPGMGAEEGEEAEEDMASPQEVLPLDSMLEELNALAPEDALTVIVQALRDRPELAPGVVAAACPDLTFAPARIAVERRQQGRIKAFNEAKGYGFIECAKVKDAFGSDAFLRNLGSFAVGQEVNFVVLLSDENKPQAFDLQPVNVITGQPILRKGPQIGSTPARPQMLPGGMGPPPAGPPPLMMAGKGMPPMAMMMGMPPGMSPGMLGMPSGMAPPGMQGKMPVTVSSPGKTARPAAGGLDSKRYRGLFARISSDGGWGFIECGQTKQQYGCDVFVHKNHAATLEVGSEVSFGVTIGSKGKPQAANVQVLSKPKQAGGSSKRKADEAKSAGRPQAKPTKKARGA